MIVEINIKELNEDELNLILRLRRSSLSPSNVIKLIEEEEKRKARIKADSHRD